MAGTMVAATDAPHHIAAIIFRKMPWNCQSYSESSVVVRISKLPHTIDSGRKHPVPSASIRHTTTPLLVNVNQIILFIHSISSTLSRSLARSLTTVFCATSSLTLPLCADAVKVHLTAGLFVQQRLSRLPRHRHGHWLPPTLPPP